MKGQGWAGALGLSCCSVPSVVSLCSVTVIETIKLVPLHLYLLLVLFQIKLVL